MWIRRGQRRTGTWAEQHTRDAFTYEIQTLRELEQDAMLWQAPIIALTAQAFLLTIALGADSTSLARTLAAALGVLVSALAVHSMLKHRFLAEADGDHLQELEQRLGLPDRRQRKDEHGRYRRQATRRHGSMYSAWLLGLSAFGLVNLAVIPLAWVAPELLGR